MQLADFGKSIEDLKKAAQALAESAKQKASGKDGPLGSGKSPFGGSKDPIKGPFADVLDSMKPLLKELESKGKAAGTPKFAGITGAASAAGGAIGGAASLATGAFSTVLEFANSLAPFVDAFSPSTVLQFNQVLYDTQAVIGRALEPVLQGVVMVLKEFGALLLPIAEQLTPIFQELASTAIQLVIPWMEAFAAQLQFFIPVLKFFADIIAAMTPYWRALLAILSAVMDAFRQTIADLFAGGGDGVKSWMDNFKNAVLSATKHLLIMAAYVAKLFGGDTFLKSLEKALSGGLAAKKDATGQGAARNATFTNFADYGRQMALAASTAMGGEKEPKKQEELFADVVKEIQAIRDNNSLTTTQILAKIADAAEAIAEKIVKGLSNKAYDRAQQTVQEAGQGAKSVAKGAAVGAMFGPVGAAVGAGIGFINRNR